MPATEEEPSRLDIMPELIAALQEGRASIVGKKPYKVNGRPMVALEIEWDES